MNWRLPVYRPCAFAATLAFACGDIRPSPTTSVDPGLSLMDLEPASLTLPPDSRGGHPPPDTLPLEGWTEVEGSDRKSWRTKSPIRPHVFYSGLAPPGVEVIDRGGLAVPHASMSEGGPFSWTMGPAGVTFIGLRSGDPPPLRIREPAAAARESRLNARWAGLADPAAFSRASPQVGPDTWTGLLVPAPGEVAFDLTVPPAAELWWRPVLVPPEVRDLAGSDGVDVQVLLTSEGETTTLATVPVDQEGPGDLRRHDLSRWVGQRVRLSFRTDPRATSVQDYLLIAEPAVTPRRRAPKRVILAFIDTLRADHTTLYGYHRDTTPWLAAQGARGRVYTQARSIAPWTLPAWRATITGRLPRAWGSGPTIPAVLRARGWATAMFAGNLYLSQRFGGHLGFGQHHLRAAPNAPSQVERAKSWLASVPDRDVFLVVHFMDAHLPYQEQEAYRNKYAGPAPRGWRNRFGRNDVISRATTETERTWIRDRYDNNVRQVDDTLADLDRALRPDDLLVVFSDHGEEFWEHGGFEHGHATWDEVLRIPLVLRGPGISAGFDPTPVSLLDLGPTILAWAGAPPLPTDGAVLLGSGPPADRTIPFGHALYGFERWGVTRGSLKYTSTQGWEGVYDVQADPKEQRDLWRTGAPEGAERWRQDLGIAHQAPSRVGWRFGVTTGRSSAPEGGLLEVEVPGGVVAAWAGEDALGAGRVDVEIQGERVRFRWAPGWRGQRDLYVTPARPEIESEAPVHVITGDGGIFPLVVVGHGRRPDGDPRPLGGVNLPDGTEVVWTFAVAPEPTPGSTQIIGYDPDLEAQLRAAGYVVGPTP